MIRTHTVRILSSRVLAYRRSPLLLANPTIRLIYAALRLGLLLIARGCSWAVLQRVGVLLVYQDVVPEN